jgi:hypothetical protein
MAGKRGGHLPALLGENGRPESEQPPGFEIPAEPVDIDLDQTVRIEMPRGQPPFLKPVGFARGSARREPEKIPGPTMECKQRACSCEIWRFATGITFSEADLLY